MLEINEHLTRREALRRGLMLSAGLALGPSATLATPKREFKPRAKSVIQIWLWGGAVHLDTFDPKPEAGSDYCGSFDSPISTNVDGIQINQLLTNLAGQADKYSLIRSMTHGVNGHETASYLVQTGHQPGRFFYPTFGAVVSYFKGYRGGYKGIVPPNIVLTQGQGRFSEAGFLGDRYKPYATGGDPNQNVFAVEGIVARGITDERQVARWNLMKSLDTFGKAQTASPQLQQFADAQQSAYDIYMGKAKELFNLSSEGDKMRDAYGRNTFGQSCLMARRLVEYGVPYITINYKGWDTHKKHFQTMQRKLPELDQGLAMLLKDLADHGLLDSTIVWCGGEFGRTPKILWNPPWSGGRGHFGHCFSALVAGGGFTGGSVIGKSDARGETVADRPVYPADVLGSMYELMGIDPEGDLPNPHGQEMKIMPEKPADGSPRGGRLREIMPTV